jgi:hypothetical protein
MPGESYTSRQTRRGTSESEPSSLHPLRDIQVQVQGQQPPLTPACDPPPGTKPDQSPDDQRVTLVPSLLLMPTVEHQSRMAVQAVPSVSPSTNVNVNASGNVTGSSLSICATATPVPVPATSKRPARPESPLAHTRRSAGPNHVPPVHVETLTSSTLTYPIGTVSTASSECYRLSIALPRPGGALFASEMITVSARRGGRLAVVADAWHLEHDCE